MIADGFDLTGFDGQVDQAGALNRLPRPFELHGVRPDACGVHVDGKGSMHNISVDHVVSAFSSLPAFKGKSTIVRHSLW